MISSTLKQYKDNYNVNLSIYLDEYEDNTKAFFLQSEKANYQAYQNALTKISNQLKMFTREELNNNLVHKSIAADLKKINSNAYNSIITELNQSKESNVISLYSLKNDKINIDEKALENHIKSSIVILKFISEEYEEAIQTKSKIIEVKDNEVILVKEIKNAWFIDEEFIEQIRLLISMSIFLFDCNEDNINIVSDIQTHEHLLNNFKIDDAILRFYYSPTRSLMM